MRTVEGFSFRLGSTRELAGIDPTDLDRIAGLSRGHTALLESGAKADPSSSTVAKLSSALGVSCDWLIRGTAPAPTAESVRAAVAEARVRRSQAA